jgi:polyhydroxybutyrate depolymerase
MSRIHWPSDTNTPMRACFLTLLGCLLFASAPAGLYAQVGSIVHDDVRRRYIVYTPASYEASPDRQYAVVLNFHGGGMTMAEQMLYTGMNRTADRHDFIVVYPQGIAQDWNVGFEQSYSEGTDDVGFTAALLDRLEQDYRIDRQRVFATGLSRGGFFTHRLAAELSHRIAAIAAVGAPLPQPVIDQQPGGASSAFKVGVMLVHGTADRIVLYEGKAGGYLSAAESFSYWTASNGVGEVATTLVHFDRDPADGTSIRIHETADGPHRVALVTVHEGGHTWSGADPFNIGLPIGRTSTEIDLNETIWRFFALHRR